MFGLFKRDPKKQLEARLAATLERARDAQRSGKLHEYGDLTAEAEAIAEELDRLTGAQANGA